MKVRLVVWCVRLGILGLLFGGAGHRVISAPRPAADSTFTPFTPDKGHFRILQQGQEAGTEEFSVQASGNAWVIEDETVIRVPGSAEMRTSGQLRISSDGTPQHYSWNAEGAKKASGAVEFENGMAKTSASIAGAKEPVLRDFKFASPRVAVLDNNLYEQYAIVARLYDWNAKGKQTFPVLIPQDATPGSIDVESLGTKNVDGANVETLDVHSTDLEIQLYFDAKLHLVRLEVPSAGVVITRQ